MKPPVKPSNEKQPLMSSPSKSYGMCSPSPIFSASTDNSPSDLTEPKPADPPNTGSKPSRFAVAKSPGLHTPSQTPDIAAGTEFKGESNEARIESTPQRKRSVEDVLKLSHDNSEVYI